MLVLLEFPMNVFNIIVGIITIIGLIITIYQIRKTNSAAHAAEIASMETKKRVDASFLLPDIAELVQYARFVKSNALSGNYDAALIRLQDVKDKLFKYEEPLKEDLRLYKKTVEKLDLCMRTLDIARCEKGFLAPGNFSEDVESVISGLNSIQNLIKSKTL